MVNSRGHQQLHNPIENLRGFLSTLSSTPFVREGVRGAHSIHCHIGFKGAHFLHKGVDQGNWDSSLVEGSGHEHMGNAVKGKGDTPGHHHTPQTAPQISKMKTLTNELNGEVDSHTGLKSEGTDRARNRMTNTGSDY